MRIEIGCNGDRVIAIFTKEEAEAVIRVYYRRRDETDHWLGHDLNIMMDLTDRLALAIPELEQKGGS